MKVGEIWLCELPNYEGHEQRSMRPCIMLTQPYLGLMTIVPLTSNLKALRFEYTTKLVRNEINKLEKDSVALTFQIQTIDIRRMLKKVGMLNKKQKQAIEQQVKKYLQL